MPFPCYNIKHPDFVKLAKAIAKADGTTPNEKDPDGINRAKLAWLRENEGQDDSAKTKVPKIETAFGLIGMKPPAKRKFTVRDDTPAMRAFKDHPQIKKILENGRLESWSAYKKRNGLPENAPRPDMYAGVGNLGKGFHASAIFGGEQTPDKAATRIGLDNPDQLWDTIREAMNFGENARKSDIEDRKAENPDEEAIANEEARQSSSSAKAKDQKEEFDAANVDQEGHAPIPVEFLEPGSTVTVDGEDMKVMEVHKHPITRDVESVTLEDGKRFGRQVVHAGDEVYAEYTEQDDFADTPQKPETPKPTPNEQEKQQEIQPEAEPVRKSDAPERDADAAPKGQRKVLNPKEAGGDNPPAPELFSPDEFRKEIKDAKPDSELAKVKIGGKNALGAYRALTAKRDAGNELSPEEHQTLLDAEQALGQKMAFDMEAGKLGGKMKEAAPLPESGKKPPVRGPKEVQQSLEMGGEDQLWSFDPDPKKGVLNLLKESPMELPPISDGEAGLHEAVKAHIAKFAPNWDGKVEGPKGDEPDTFIGQYVPGKRIIRINFPRLRYYREVLGVSDAQISDVIQTTVSHEFIHAAEDDVLRDMYRKAKPNGGSESDFHEWSDALRKDMWEALKKDANVRPAAASYIAKMPPAMRRDIMADRHRIMPEITRMFVEQQTLGKTSEEAKYSRGDSQPAWATFISKTIDKIKGWLGKTPPKELAALIEATKAKLKTYGVGEAKQPERPVDAGDGGEPVYAFGSKLTKEQIAKIPFLDAVGSAVHGVKQWFLPSARSPEHLKAAQDIRAEIGPLYGRQESVNNLFKKAGRMFTRLKVENPDTPLDDNAGIKFASARSAGRDMKDEFKDPKQAEQMQRINDLADLEDNKRLTLLEKAGAALSKIREDYFPGIWTDRSRKAFNKAMDDAREAGIIPEGVGVNDTTPDQRAWVKAKADEYHDADEGSDENDHLGFITKRPLHGQQEFRKQKVFDEDIKTAYEMGLRPFSYNPITQMKLKWASMDKAILGANLVKKWKSEGNLKTVDPFAEVPKGQVEMNDRYGKVYGPPTIEVPEYVNKAVYDGLMAVAERLGLSPERKMAIGGKRLGYASKDGRVVTKFATDLSVLAHEIGHQLDFKYDLWDGMVEDAQGIGKRGDVTKQATAAKKAEINQELRDLADLTWEGTSPSEGYKKYARSKAEKMAHLLEGYIGSRDLFKQTAPEVFRSFESFIRSKPELKDLEHVNRRMTFEKLTGEKYLGLVQIGKRIIPEAYGEVLDNYLSSSIYNNRFFGKLYKGWMGMANMLNQVQLGVGSAFHAGFMASEAQVSQHAEVLKDIFGVMNGSRSIKDLGKNVAKSFGAIPLTYKDGDQMLNAWRKPDGVIDPKIAQLVRAAELGGFKTDLEPVLQTNQASQAFEDWYGGNKAMAVARSPFAAIEMLAHPIMKGLVPRMKMGLFAHMAGRVIEMNPGKSLEELTPQFSDIVNRVDSRMGQVGYERLMMNKVAKNIVQGAVRAPGWSFGTIAELGGSFKDTYKFFEEWTKTGKLPKDIPDRVAYMVSLLTTVAATNALLTYMFTGEHPKDLKWDNLDYWAFRTGGKDEHGNPERFVLPTYMKDVLAYTKEPLQTLWNKQHPIIGIAHDLWANKDYYGVEIKHEDDKSYRQMLDTGKYIAKAFVPFWMRGYQKAKDRGDSFARSMLPQIGIMPAPAKMTRSKAESLAIEYGAQMIPQGARTKEEAEASKRKYEIIEKLREKKPVNIGEEIKSGHIKPRDVAGLIHRSQMTHLQYAVNKLKLDKAEHVYAEATPAEKKQLEKIMFLKRIKAGFPSDGSDDDE